MDNIHFSAATIVGALLEGCLAVLLPVVLIVVWKLKTKAKLVPFWVGCAIFPLFALVLEAIAAMVITIIDRKTLHLLEKPLPLYLFSAAMAGIFEETGRFFGMKVFMRKYKDRRDGVTYGIGHGGIESVLLIGGSAALTVFVAILTNSGMLNTMMSAYDESLKTMLLENLGTMTSSGFSVYMLGFFERISAIILHISLSVLVFSAARQKDRLWLYPLAIFLHFAADCTVILPRVLETPLWLFEILFFAVSVALALPVFRYYRSLPQVLGEEQSAVTENTQI